MDKIYEKKWWSYLPEDQKDLLIQSLTLLEREKDQKTTFHDYSFIVFPAAKAYEGFLKKLFWDLGFINEQEYKSDRFRIGKALNPNLEKHLRIESIYDKLIGFCQDRRLPDFLWQTWKQSRNSLFHWWPKEENFIDLALAEEKLNMIVQAIDKAFEECKIKR